MHAASCHSFIVLGKQIRKLLGLTRSLAQQEIENLGAWASGCELTALCVRSESGTSVEELIKKNMC